MPLPAVAGDALDLESGGDERIAHGRSGRPGRERSTRAGEARNRTHRRFVPHRRVAGGREAVEKDRVGRHPQPAHHARCIAQAQVQHGVGIVELDRVHPGQSERPARTQARGVGGVGAERLVHAREVRARERVRFDRNEMQAQPRGRDVAPGRERLEEIQPGAETEFEHREGPCDAGFGSVQRAPSLRQRASFDEHLARLGARAAAAAEDVAEARAEGRAALIEDDRRVRFDRVHR